MTSKKFSSKMLQRKYASQLINKRKSDDILASNFVNKLSSINNNKISKIPSNLRYSCQNKNLFLKNKALNNEDKDTIDNNNTNNHKIPIKKDKNYYLNLLNEIYLNDSHLSNINSNNETCIKASKKLMKKKTCNFSKIKIFKDSQTIKSSKNLKKLTLKFNNGNKNPSNENNNIMINNNKNDKEKKENSKSKLCIKENNDYKRFCSDNCIAEFKCTEALVKVKIKENYKRLRSSKAIINENKYINKKLNEPLEHKELSKLSKLNNKNKENKLENNKRSRNNENQFENENVSLENINTKNITNNTNLNCKSNTKKNNIKMYKTCFCCLIKNNDDDSF